MVRRITSFFILLVHWGITTVVRFTKRGSSDSVAILRLDAIGDFILWQGSAKMIKKLYPGKRTILIASHVWADLAKELPYWDEVWPIHRKKFNNNIFYRISWLRKIRRAGFQTIIQPRNSREFLFEDMIIRLSGALDTIGAKGNCANIPPWLKKISDRFYTRLIDSGGPQDTELAHSVQFIHHLGAADSLPRVSPFPTVARLPNEFCFKRPYVIIAPGALRPFRRWPISSFTQFADRFLSTKNLLGVVCGSPDEEMLCEDLVRSSQSEMINLAGKISLREFVEVVREANLLVGNETSGIHIAAAVRTPSVCILGGGHFGRFLPYPQDKNSAHFLPRPVYFHMDCYGCNWQCRYDVKNGNPAPCIKNIAVDHVLEAARKLIER